jgi:hypothetical protein
MTGNVPVDPGPSSTGGRSINLEEPDSCRLAWIRQPFRAWGAASPSRNATRCGPFGFGGGRGFFYWNSSGLQVTHPLGFNLVTILGHSAPRLGTPWSACVNPIEAGSHDRGKNLRCTCTAHAHCSTLPLAVKSEGPLRCIVARCVVNDEVRHNVTCRPETTPARLIAP